MSRKTWIFLLTLIVVGISAYASQRAPATSRAVLAPGTTAGGTSAILGSQTKSTGCAARGALPDADCTPGAVLSGATKEAICQNGYSKTVRNVSAVTKHAVFSAYGITTHGPGEYEVDHLVSLELGGSNDIANLWPEAADPTPGFHEKDVVENYLHTQLCSGKMSLQQVQQAVSSNWLDVYKNMQ